MVIIVFSNNKVSLFRFTVGLSLLLEILIIIQFLFEFIFVHVYVFVFVLLYMFVFVFFSKYSVAAPSDSAHEAAPSWTQTIEGDAYMHESIGKQTTAEYI